MCYGPWSDAQAGGTGSHLALSPARVRLVIDPVHASSAFSCGAAPSWDTRRGPDIVLIKTLLYTGVRVAELVAIRLDDVDLDACRIRITNGKGGKDRTVPFPPSFKETLALHIDQRRHTGGGHLFESSWKKPYSTRGVRALLARYATAAGLDHNMPPHRLRHFLSSPGSKPKASTTPSSSPTAATPAANPSRSTAASPSPTPHTPTTKPSPASPSEPNLPTSYLAAGDTDPSAGPYRHHRTPGSTSAGRLQGFSVTTSRPLRPIEEDSRHNSSGADRVSGRR